MKRYPSVDAFGSLQVDAADPTRLDGVGDAYFFAGAPYRGGFGEKRSADIPDGECFAPCAAAAFYRRETFAALGGFTEHFFCYGEDVDLGFRLRLAGGRCVQLNRAVVAHEGSGVTGRRSGFTMYHGHRNRIWTYVRNMPGPIFWPGLPFHLLVNAYLLLRFAPRNEAGPYLRALRDAVRAAPREWRARREIQAARVASVAAIARALTWSPLKLAGKRPDLRPLPQPATTEKVG
ncbi:MAG: glycosyltransferase family 2 protein [Parvularculaceae bacterium]